MAVPASVNEVAASQPGDLLLVDIRKKPDEQQIPGSVRYDGEEIERADRAVRSQPASRALLRQRQLVLANRPCAPRTRIHQCPRTRRRICGLERRRHAGGTNLAAAAVGVASDDCRSFFSRRARDAADAVTRPSRTADRGHASARSGRNCALAIYRICAGSSEPGVLYGCARPRSNCRRKTIGAASRPHQKDRSDAALRLAIRNRLRVPFRVRRRNTG